jgi:2-(1,2-epoxy-1,2-dihydrophenyl)acetyl-CoA isomerase
VTADAELLGGDLLHRVEDGVAWIRLNRPDAGNALTPDQRNTIIDLLRRCDEDRKVRVVVLASTGRHFCTGADLRVDRPELEPDVETLTGRLPSGIMKSLSYGVSRLTVALQDCQKPIVASVHGTAAGIGVQMAVACDLVLMAEEASFIEIFVRRGIVADGGAAYLLTRLVGVQRTKELLLLGDRVNSAKALQYGLVTEVLPLEALEARTVEIARTLADGPTVAIGLMKRLANRALDVDRTTALFEEVMAQELTNASLDAREGVASFLEKRPSKFRGY